MNFVNPMALFWLGLIPLIVLLYFLKLKRREIPISSTYLWKKSVMDLHVNAPFQRLRKNILLLLQILILAAAIFASIGKENIQDTKNRVSARGGQGVLRAQQKRVIRSSAAR